MRDYRGLASSVVLATLMGSMPAPCAAQWNLTEGAAEIAGPEGSRSAMVRYAPRLTYTIEAVEQPDAVRDILPLSLEGLDPVEDWDLIAIAKAAEAHESEPITTTGTLVALPGHSTEWSFEVFPARLRDAVTVKEAIVGTMPCLHVVVDRAMAGSPGETIEIQIVADSPRATDQPRRSVSPNDESSRIARSIFINGDSLESIPLSSRATDRSRDVISIPPPPGEWRVTYLTGDRLLAIPMAGLVDDESDVDNLRFDHHGDLLPVIATIDGEMLVYAPRRHTSTDNNDSLFVTLDEDSPSPVLATRGAFNALVPSAGEIAQASSRVYRYPDRYERGSTLPIGDRFVFYRIQRPQTLERELPLNDYLTSPDIFMQIRILGLDTNPSFTPDHFADIALEGVSIPRIEWKGRTQVQRSQTVTLGSLPNPPSLTLTHSVPTVVAISDLQNLRDVTLAWTGYPRLDETGKRKVDLPVSAGARRVTIGGFAVGTTADDVIVLDVTNPKLPVRLSDPFLFTDVTGTVAVQFEAPAAAGAYFAQRIDAAESSALVTAAEQLPPSTGPSETLEAIYVRDPILAETLQPLIAAQGTDVLEIDPQAAYNAYNGGQQDPEAIRLAVRDLLNAADQRELLPRLVLVGDGTFDRRNYLGLTTTPQVPIYVDLSLPEGGIEIENSVDQYYGLLFGDDQLEDVQIGRMPVKTVGELEIIVDRVLAHRAIEEELKELPRLGVFASDDPRPGESVDYRIDGAMLAEYWEDSGRHSAIVELTGSKNPAFSQTKALLEGGDGGALMLLYTGHGNVNVWGDESYLTGDDIPGLDTEGKWPLVTTFSCLNSYYAIPGQITVPLGKRWITTQSRGAIATITPTGPELYLPQLQFSILFVEEMRKPIGIRQATIGGTFTAARINYMTQIPEFNRTARTFLLFGDPGSSITLPTDSEYDLIWIY